MFAKSAPRPLTANASALSLCGQHNEHPWLCVTWRELPVFLTVVEGLETTLVLENRDSVNGALHVWGGEQGEWKVEAQMPSDVFSVGRMRYFLQTGLQPAVCLYFFLS